MDNLSNKARAESYRQKAEEIKTVAESMIDPQAKQMMEDMAEDYLHMADILENLAERTTRPK